MNAPDPRLMRAHREIEAARYLVRGGYLSEAISRAYFAAFHAAEAALLVLGETRSKHSAVISAFTQRLVRTGEIDKEVARMLRSLFEGRNEADYTPREVAPSAAEAAIADAQRVIDAVEAWLAERG